MWEFGTQLNSIISMINRAVPYYISGLAVAVGFKMNLFNIGVEGQYYLAGILAAVVGAWLDLPAPLRSEEHTSELQSLMRISYAVFCLTKKKTSMRKHA